MLLLIAILGLEDSGLPRVVGGPTGTPISEDMAVKDIRELCERACGLRFILGFSSERRGRRCTFGVTFRVACKNIANIATC